MNRALRPFGVALIAGAVLMIFAGVAFPARALPALIVLTPVAPATADRLAEAADEIDRRLAAEGFDQAESRASAHAVEVRIGEDFAGTVRQMLADISSAGELSPPFDVSSVRTRTRAGSTGRRFLFFAAAALFVGAGAWIVRRTATAPPRRTRNPNGAGRLSSDEP